MLRPVRQTVRALGSLVLLLFLLGPGTASADEWVLTDSGVCERHWSSDSWKRGPVAMANGVALPFRTLGAVTQGLWPAVLTPVSFLFGTVEGAMWVATGAFDTLTVGALGASPPGADAWQSGSIVVLPQGHRDLSVYDPTAQCTPAAWTRPNLETQGPR